MSTTLMKSAGETFESFLNQHDGEDWLAAVTALLRSIHEVDKAATQIWFAFYPLKLFLALQAASDSDRLARQLLLQGKYYLKDQIDTSHTFLYGHRYWPQVKRAVADHATQWHRLQSVTSPEPQGEGDSTSSQSKVRATSQTKVRATSQTEVRATSQTEVRATSQTEVRATSQTEVRATSQTEVRATSQTEVRATSQTEVRATSLADQILEVADSVAKQLKVDVSLVVGITAVAFMTVRQAGIEAFNSTPGEALLDSRHARKSPEEVLKGRAKDDSQGLFGFLKTVDKKWTVTYDENDSAAKYKLNHAQDLAWGAADDRTRNWREIDPRRIEGPIPVECRSASCGTCWVGVLGGAEKLSDVATREGKQIKKFGYIDTNESRPLIRLACQGQAQGAVSIVIPPWNGVFGKYLEEDLDR